MYKVRKCLSIESLKKKDDLSEYISDFKNAEKKVIWQNLHKNSCMCITSCKKSKDFGGKNNLDADEDNSINQLSERMQYYVNQIIMEKAKLIVRKLKIQGIQSFEIIPFVKKNIIGDVSYFQLQREYRQACVETYNLNKMKEKCLAENEVSDDLIKQECCKFCENEELKEKVHNFIDTDPVYQINVSDYQYIDNPNYSIDLESYYDSDFESVDQNLEKWNFFVKKQICIANLMDYELEKSIFVKREASKTRIYMKYLLLKQQQRSRKIEKEINDEIEKKKMRETHFIDCFGFSPFGSPITRSNKENHVCFKNMCSVCRDFENNQIYEDNQINSFV